MASPLLVRTVHVDDWQTYRTIRLRALHDSPDAYASTHAAEVIRSDDQWIARLTAASTSGKDRPVFAICDGEICGLAWCKVSTDPAVAELFQMWVHPTYRGQGVGGALLQQAIAWARQVGVDRLRLGVTDSDSPAMRLYRSHGFRPIGELEPLREDCELMARTLELELGAA